MVEGVSSNIIEVIKTVLNFLFFMIRFHKHKKAQIYLQRENKKIRIKKI